MVAIDVVHIDGPDGDGAGTLLIPTSKTDREGQRAHAYLSPTTTRAIDRWREKGGIHTGPLFRRVETYFDGTVRLVGPGALHPGTIRIIYEQLVRQAFAKKLLGPMRERARAMDCGDIEPLDSRVALRRTISPRAKHFRRSCRPIAVANPNTAIRYGAKLAAKGGASARLAKRFAVV